MDDGWSERVRMVRFGVGFLMVLYCSMCVLFLLCWVMCRLGGMRRLSRLHTYSG